MSRQFKEICFTCHSGIIKELSEVFIIHCKRKNATRLDIDSCSKWTHHPEARFYPAIKYKEAG